MTVKLDKDAAYLGHVCDSCGLHRYTGSFVLIRGQAQDKLPTGWVKVNTKHYCLNCGKDKI